MLTHTFCHIPNIGPTTERTLWRAGIHDWQTLLDNVDDAPIGTAAKVDVQKTLERSMDALAKKEHQYFAKKLGLAESWRAFPDFRDELVYLDIETDGGQRGDSVTLIGLYGGGRFRALTKGDDIEEFKDVISHYGMIVTFFGSGFDLPMLERRFWGFKFDQIHLDLCPTLRRLGYKGGLKKIEKQVGIARDEETDGLSGMDAVILWNQYLRGDEDALRRLVAYNEADVVNLETLAELAYSKLKAAVFDPHSQPTLL